MARKTAPEVSAREAALEVLLRVEKGAFLDALLGPAVDRLSDRREAALLTRLAYGVETWRARLDWTLAALSSRSPEHFEPAVRGALRLGLFQLLFLDRVPHHAAVDTSVELAKRTSPGGSRVVNAILRRALRDGEAAPPPDDVDAAAHLAIRWSHPEWLVRRWIDERGRAATEALLAANNEAGPSAFRVDLRRASRDDMIASLAERGVVAHASPYARAAVVIEGPVSSVSDVQGLEAQSVASQIVAEIVGPAAGDRTLDLCAAPGGKAAALAESQPDARVIASDRARGGIRHTAARRSGRSGLFVLRADGTHPPFAPNTFDTGLVDAPCSGLGTLRAHPELRWRRDRQDVIRLAALQRRLLDSAAPLIRPGGRLVYATCTTLAEENEDNVADFLAHHPTWTRDDPRDRIGDAATFVGEDLALRTSPDLGGLDGFFAVALRNGGGSV
ncbi:MAG: 16S rRNA (cytosine(967)-C(5))-methyltransferase RsmB [Candidatus Binatia bacterium]|nr:16S rRNA (cytosine(967)-C(5))-methyltransferase RsmB [Candidatus Binatia bacterium]